MRILEFVRLIKKKICLTFFNVTLAGVIAEVSNKDQIYDTLKTILFNFLKSNSLFNLKYFKNCQY